MTQGCVKCKVLRVDPGRLHVVVGAAVIQGRQPPVRETEKVVKAAEEASAASKRAQRRQEAWFPEVCMALNR